MKHPIPRSVLLLKSTRLPLLLLYYNPIVADISTDSRNGVHDNNESMIIYVNKRDVNENLK